jgi:hypothetical protein
MIHVIVDGRPESEEQRRDIADSPYAQILQLYPVIIAHLLPQRSRKDFDISLNL